MVGISAGRGVLGGVGKPIRATGRVMFYRSEKGWGGIASDDVPADVWVRFSAIDRPGCRELQEGEAVQFECRRQQQDGWQYLATWVRPGNDRP